MRSARLLPVLGFALVLAAFAVPAQASQDVLIRHVDTSKFPQVLLTVSVASETPISATDVKLTENGNPVAGVSVRALPAAEQGIDVILAIDTSNSMAGAPLAAAVAAAKQFLQNAPAEVQVGVITFNDAVLIAHPIDTDRAGALAALDNLKTRNGTALYKAIIQASELFSGTNQRNIILLSDGADTSGTTFDDASSAATTAKATIFGIGLQTPGTDFTPLRGLAENTKGTFATVEQADLTVVYQRLLSAISHQYVISYTSTAPNASTASVEVTLPQGSDSSLISIPASASIQGQAPATKPSTPVLHGGVGLAVVLFLCFVAALGILVMLVGQNARQRREKEILRRLTQPGTIESGPIREEEGRIIGQWAPSLVAAGKRLAESAGFMTTLEQKLERASLPISPGEFVAASGVAVLVGAIVGGIFLQSGVFALIFAVVGGALPTVFLGVAIERRMRRLHTQLPDILMILASSLRAGHSFLQALDTVSKEVGDPGAKEFSRVIAEIRLGRPVDEAMNAMAERVGSDDFKWAVLAVNIQREVGGNLAEVLDTVAETVRDRDTIRRQVEVLSAEGKLSMWILIALPLVIGLYLFKVNNDYVRLLYTTRAGGVMLVTAGSLLVLGVFWMRKIVKIDV